MLTQDDFGELQYTVINGFDVPITIIDVTLADEPTSNMKVSTYGIPVHHGLQPGQSVMGLVEVGTSACALPRYSFNVMVQYTFVPLPPMYRELQFEVVKKR